MRNRQPGCVGSKLAEVELTPAFGMVDCSVFRHAAFGIYVPSLCRGLNKHLARSCSRFPQIAPASLDTPAPTGPKALKPGPRHRLFDAHARPISAELVGQDHEQRGPHALTHFGFPQGQSDCAFVVDSNPSVRSE